MLHITVPFAYLRLPLLSVAQNTPIFMMVWVTRNRNFSKLFVFSYSEPKKIDIWKNIVEFIMQKKSFIVKS